MYFTLAPLSGLTAGTSDHRRSPRHDRLPLGTQQHRIGSGFGHSSTADDVLRGIGLSGTVSAELTGVNAFR
jgi:hypothetical protein